MLFWARFVNVLQTLWMRQRCLATTSRDSRKRLKLVRPDRGWSGGRPYMELGGRASAPYIAELIFLLLLRQNGVSDE